MSDYVILINGEARAVGTLDPEIERLLDQISKPVTLPGLRHGYLCGCPGCAVEDLELEAEKDRLLLLEKKRLALLTEPPYAPYVVKPNRVSIRPMGEGNLWNDDELEF